ncbi:MAG TPA: hypothetical protein VKG25_00835 [Bryobacteraceae bacterium]|nr:hypothetical protein [Bryobacteraceae bacterium]
MGPAPAGRRRLVRLRPSIHSVLPSGNSNGNFGEQGLEHVEKRVPRLQLPDWLVRLAAKRDKARRMLGWSPRSNEDAVVATAESLMRFGLLKH